MTEPNPFVAPQEVTDNSAPSRTRFLVLGLLCLLSGILYIDRICISSARTVIGEELKLSPQQTGYFMMAFTLAYGLFEIPTGRWGDVLGTRRVLTRISLWWSAFTAFTGLCTGLYSLVIVRFLFGAGEAGAFPNAARVMSRWFPDHERGRVHGVFLAASQIGGAISPILATELIDAIGWRLTFVVFGSLGAVWAAVFWWWFRDDPAEHPGVNAAEVRHIGRRATSGTVHAPIPWSLVAINPSVWFLSLIMMCASFNSYIYFGWYQTCLTEGRGIPNGTASRMVGLVLLLSAAGTYTGGALIDRFISRGSVNRRRIMGGTCFLLAAGFLGSALLSNDPWTAATLTALSCFTTQMTQPLWWSCSTGVSGRHVGSLLGLMNSVGVFGAMTSTFLVGWIADFLKLRGYSGRDQWDPIFYINIGVLLTACVLWSFFRFQPVEPDHADH
ncbi:MAG: MFS transporter [Planctomyces sp.]